ncbi:MAG: putative ABC transport system permease protein [Saprospiraceae bacterium]|jgi:putative ABC transport system permease protein
MNIFKLSWKNLTSKPLAMLLSLVLFALGVGLISLLLLINKQLEDKFQKNLAGIDLVVGAKGSPLQLILNSMYHVDAPTGNITIGEAKAFLREGHPLIKIAVPLSVGDSYESYRIIGTNHKILELYKAKIGSGQLWKGDFEVTIGATLADILNLKIGDEFNSSHGFVSDGINEHTDVQPFKVVGILAPTGSVIDQLILTNTSSIWKVHGSHDADEIEAAHNETIDTTIAAQTISGTLLDYPDEEITSVLIRFSRRNMQTLNMGRNINENTDMMAAMPAYEINRLYGMMGAGEQLLKMVAFVIVFVSGLSIFISLFDSLRDRKYELALMRVMGASKLKLFLLIILEGVILAVIGFLVGIALSHIGMSILSNYMESSYRYSFSGSVFLIEEFYLLIGALLIGIIAAVIPAIQASNTDISETLTDS